MNENEQHEHKKMIDNIKKQPQFSGDGVAVWINQDKNGNDYLSIKILNNPAIYAFSRKTEEK